MNNVQKFSDPYWLLTTTKDQKQEFVIVLEATRSIQAGVKTVKQYLNQKKIDAYSTNVISDKITEVFIEVSNQQAWVLFKELLIQAKQKEFDLVVLPVSSRRKKLLVCDMDSTIVASETLDDIAAHAGIGEQVAKITARAMRGELEFRQALDERVSLLKGMSASIFEETAKTVQLNHGADILLKQSKKNNIRTVLVSGGFEPIVKAVAEKLDFDRFICNKMEVSNGKLTGKVFRPIVDSETKLNALVEECRQLDINPDEVCAIGDGANDIPMLEEAGLGIGFMGKPLVCSVTPYQINSTSLEFVISMMGLNNE